MKRNVSIDELNIRFAYRPVIGSKIEIDIAALNWVPLTMHKNSKLSCIIIHSKYFFVCDWLSIHD